MAAKKAAGAKKTGVKAGVRSHGRVVARKGAAMGVGAGAATTSTVFRVQKPLVVELRAEEEPAVTLGADVVARVAQARAGRVVQAAPEVAVDTVARVVRRGWWERLTSVFAKKEETAVEGSDMAAHLATVKAGVMQELETIGAKKGVKLAGSPFAGVLLPVQPQKKDVKRGGGGFGSGKWALAGLLLLVLVVGMIYTATREQTPDMAVAGVVRALQTGDADRFAKLVDVPEVAQNVAAQLAAMDPADAKALQVDALLQPGLVARLERELPQMAKGMDGTSLPHGLRSLVTGDGALRLGSPRIGMNDDHLAVAEVPLVRDDLAVALPLQVVLEHRGDAWVVTQVPNLANVLAGMAAAEADVARAAAAKAAQVAAAGPVAAGAVTVQGFDKPVARDGAPMRIWVRLANRGAAVSGGQMAVSFGDADGRPLLALRLPVQGTVAAGTVQDMVWSVPVDTTDPHAVAVAKLPLAAMTVTATLVY